MAQMAEVGHSLVPVSGDDIISIHSQAPLTEHPASMGMAADDPDPFLDPAVVGSTAAVAGATTERHARNTAQAASKQQKQPFYKTPVFVLTIIVVALLGIVLLFILLYPLVHGVAQRILNVASVGITSIVVRNPQNSSFDLSIAGVITHTAHINAKLTFNNPVDVYWVTGSQEHKTGKEIKLGTMTLAPVYSRKARVILNQHSTFAIVDEAAMGSFTQAMITSDSFTWRLKSESVTVNALKFPVINGLSFSTDLQLAGINSFNNKVVLTAFHLPSDNPAGGINFQAHQTLTNPSAFDIQLGTVVFDLYAQDVFLGQGTGQNVGIAAKGPTPIELDGVLVPHIGDPHALDVLGEVFSGYISGDSVPVVAKGVSTRQSNGDYISWLSSGISALSINVPLKSPTPIAPIQSIDIGYLNLTFTPETSWAPATASNDIIAELSVPFGFSLSVSHIQNTFNISQNGTAIAGLSTPDGAATSDIVVHNSTETGGPVNITLNDTPLVVLPGADGLFSQFTHDLTLGQESVIQLVGHAHAIANLSLGVLTLDPIKFNVTSVLRGFNSLNTKPTLIQSVDVLGGTTDYISLGILVEIWNPSSINLNAGDLDLALYMDGAMIGTSLLPNLSLPMGTNALAAMAKFTPNDTPQGIQTLNQFVGQQDTDLIISGYNESTQVMSLQRAFEGLTIHTTLPGLNTSLLGSAKLTVLPTTGYANNISHVTVDLKNPFTTDLSITYINSSVTAYGIPLGTIGQPVTFPAKGKATTTSPQLDFTINLDPPSIFTVVRALAIDANIGTTQFDGIVALGGYQYLPIVNTTATEKPGTAKRDSLDKRANIYTGFNLPSFVDAAFKILRADISITSSVTIGQYSTTLTYSQKQVSVQTDSTLNYLLPVLARPIVQKIVDGAVLGLSTVLITNPAEQSFNVQLNGAITSAGPFDAVINFPSGLVVVWNGAPIGTIAMPNVSVVGDVGATLNSNGAFKVADITHLTDFTKALLTQEYFNWTISAPDLALSALGISVPNISFSKSVSLKGMNGLQDGVIIESFDLPANDPAGGVHLTLNTAVTNPSQVGIALSSIGFHNYYETTYIGPVLAAGPFVLAPASTISLPLVGRLIPQTTPQGLADLGTIFTNYVHGIFSNLTVNGDTASGTSGASWLENAIKSLSIGVKLPAPSNLKVINSITIEDLSLAFTRSTAWDPSAGSNTTVATFQLPFAFPIDITALQPIMTIGYHGQYIAHLPFPTLPTTTDVAARIIYLGFKSVPFDVYGNKHANFAKFLADTTMAKTETFQLIGSANTTASTAIGSIVIQDIPFSVDTSLAGLQGLNARPTNVSQLDVAHGYTDYLLITVKTALYNPSNITISTGDVVFALKLQGQQLGVAIIPNAVIIPGVGSYDTQVHFQPKGAAVPVGRVLLENYISGIDTVTSIAGTSSTTPIASLQKALAGISLSTTIPSMHTNLIQSTTIVFPDNIAQTKIAQFTFVLANPFTAAISINKIVANATYQDRLTVATIDVTPARAIHADGHTNITSQSLNLNFNTDPLTIISLLELQSVLNGVNLGPLPGLFGLVTNDPTFKTKIVATKATGASSCVSGQQFDVDTAILKSLIGLKVDLAVSSDLDLDSYATSLSFTQRNVTTNTDSSALNLITVVAPPIVQKLVNGAKISFTEANITNVKDTGFDLSLQGSVLNTGPLDALITFPDPININWNGQDIGTIVLPPICAAANIGVPNYKSSATLTIKNQAGFTSFAKYILHNSNFTWTISSPSVRVEALNIIFDNVVLTQQISFAAFNNLPGVTISNFNLPGDDPSGGITISTDALIPSVSNLGIELGNVAFTAVFEGTTVGPLSASGLFLAPQAVTSAHLSGRIIPQTGDNLLHLGDLFTSFLKGLNQTLEVHGNSVYGAQSTPVTWLTAAFQTLQLQVILPGHIYQIIESIDLRDLEVVLTDASHTFSPLTSTKDTVAVFRNPFGFSLQPVDSAENIILGTESTDIATLNIPSQPVNGGISTGNSASLFLTFNNVPLVSVNDAAFEGLFAAITDTIGVAPVLKGTVNIVARTAVGDVPIADIPFNVTTTLAGINGFNRQTTITNLSITGSGSNGAYITAPLTTTLDNPSNISLLTDTVALPTLYNGVELGRAVLSPFNLVPGTHDYPAEFHYAPADANDTVAQSFITQYISSSSEIPVTVQGDALSSPYASLQPALEGVKLSSSIKGLGAQLVANINVYITLATLLTNIVTIDFDIINPLDAELDISFIQSDSGVNGEIYAHFDQGFTAFKVPPHGSTNSGPIPNVVLTQGALLTLPIIPLGYLDLFNAITVYVGQYQLPWLHYDQSHVPVSYHLDILGISGVPTPSEVSALLSSHVSTMTASANATSSSSSVHPAITTSIR